MSLGMERLVYTSRARNDADSLLMQVDIRATSQRNNARDGLTGALLVHDGRFLQVLEGAAQDLDRLLARLADDPRHDEVRIVERGPITGRRFEGWAMASARVTPALETLLEKTLNGAWASTETLDRMQEAVQPAAAA